MYWKFKLETIKWSFVKQTVTWILSWIFVMPMPMLDILLSLLYSNTMSACLLVCVLVTYLLWNCWRDMAKLYFLALSWSGVSFWLTKFQIQDPVFPDIRKNPDFRVLFDQFGWNLQVILNLTQICLTQINFWIRYPVFQIQNQYITEKSSKMQQKSGLIVYHDVIYHFSYSNHGKLIFGTQCAIWKIFQDKGKNYQIKVNRCLEVAKWGDTYWNWMCKISKKWRIFQTFWKIFCKITIKVIKIQYT